LDDGVKQVKPPSGVWLESNFPGVLNVTGKLSGKHYVFSGGGTVVLVDSEDVEDLLTKTFGGNSCCGSGVKPLPYFTVV